MLCFSLSLHVIRSPEIQAPPSSPSLKMMKFTFRMHIVYTVLHLSYLSVIGFNNAFLFRRQETLPGQSTKSLFMRNSVSRIFSNIFLMESLQENLMENRKIRNITVSSFPNILAELIPSTQIRKTPLFKCLMQAFLFSTIFQFGNIQLNELHSREQYGSVLPYTVSLHPESAVADDELAQYAAEGHKVGVDGQCFMRKCALETSSCANDPSANCLKGLSCLARYLHYMLRCLLCQLSLCILRCIHCSCKGGSMCSTGCFAKYGSDKLDNLLSCSVEKNDCKHILPLASIGRLVNNSLNIFPIFPFEL